MTSKQWHQGSKTLRIDSWYPKSESSVMPPWHQGYVDGLRVAEGNEFMDVWERTKAEATRREELERANGHE